MKSVMGEKNYFQFNSPRNWKPVQFKQNRGDVVECARACCNFGVFISISVHYFFVFSINKQ